MPDPKFLYGSHYSTPGYVLYYLVRVGKKFNELYLSRFCKRKSNEIIMSVCLILKIEILLL